MATLNQPAETRNRPDQTLDVLSPGQTRLRTRTLRETPTQVVTTIAVANPTQSPVEVDADSRFAEATHDLEFDREAARGMRLHCPSGTVVRFEPNTALAIDLVAVD